MPQGLQNTSPGQSRTQTLFLKAAFFLSLFLVRFLCVAERTDTTIHFSSPHRYMIVVPVRVNGRGPYPFLFDTGATSSEVDPKLSTALALPTAKSARLNSWTDTTTDVRRVLVENLSLGPIDSGPLKVLVQPLLEFKALDPQLRGVLGQDVLLRSNYLIDNHRHLIEFDNDNSILPRLTGDRISIAPVRTRTGNLEPRLASILVHSDMSSEPLHLVLDSGADMLVLEASSSPPPTTPKGTKWIADQNGNRSPAFTFHTLLTVGSEAFSTEAWIGETGLKQLAIDGLLPTGSFNRLYIGNRDCFVIFDPKPNRHP